MVVIKEGEPRKYDEQEMWVSLENLEEAISNLPSPLREDVMRKAKEVSTEGIVLSEDPPDADGYLKEVTRRVFSFSLADLNPLEIMEIEKIRRDLGIDGDFDPTT